MKLRQAPHPARGDPATGAAAYWFRKTGAEGEETMYDAIVVGARCAGAPTAMLLARAGHKVLLVDRATFPSDTLSTHVIHPPGVAALRRWGLLDAVRASDCPPFAPYSLDFGPVTITGTPRPADRLSVGYAPRRTVLDKILVNAAVGAGVEVREQINVSELLFDEDGTVTGIRGNDRFGTPLTERARVVVGADGRNSMVARAVSADLYRETPKLQWSYYTYWSGLPVDGFETYLRPGRGWVAVPTNDDLTMVAVGWPVAEAAAYKADVEGNYLATLELAPSFADRIRGARREARFLGASLPGFFRVPYGPGWVLAGDAGYTKDPVTAQGISDAFADAESLAAALSTWLSGAGSYDAALAQHHRARDARVGQLYDYTAELAKLEPPSEQMQHLLGAMTTRQAAMDDFVSITAGTVERDAFFAPENLARLLQPAA